MIEVKPSQTGVVEGYNTYAGFNAAAGSEAVQTDNFQAGGIDDNLVIKLANTNVYTHAMYDRNGKQRVHASGRFINKPVVQACLMAQVLDPEHEYAVVKNIMIPANFLERVSYEWTEDNSDAAHPVFRRGTMQRGQGAVNTIFTSYTKKDEGLKDIYNQQNSHKGILVKVRVVTTLPYIEGGATKRNYDKGTETGQVEELTHTNLYNCNWVD